MRLITFGDSWTAGHGVETDVRHKHEATPPWGCEFIEKLRKANGWPRWLANKLECPYVVFANCGGSNWDSLNYIQRIVADNMFEPDDIIIVMFTHPNRDSDGCLKNYSEIEKLLAPYTRFYFNAFFPIFETVYDFDTKTLPTHFINPDGSMSDILKEYEIKNDVSVWEYNSRRVWNETDMCWVGEYHPNILGYKLIAEYIYNEIQNANGILNVTNKKRNPHPSQNLLRRAWI